MILGGCLAYPLAVGLVSAHLWDGEQAAEFLVALIIGMLGISFLLAFARPRLARDAWAVIVFGVGQIVSALLVPIFHASAVLGCMVLILLGGWALLWLPEKRRRVEVRADGFVNCPPAAVFRILGNPARMRLLTPSVRVELPSEGSVGLGFRYRYWMGPRLLPKLEFSVQVTEYRPPELIAEVHRAGDDEYLVSWSLQPEGSGTRATFRQLRRMFWGEAVMGWALVNALFRPSLGARFLRLDAACQADDQRGYP